MADYFAYNGPMTTTASYVPVSTGTAIKTMLQIQVGTLPIRIWKWGLDFDGTGTVPIKCELVHTGTIPATGMVAHVASGVQPYGPEQQASTVTLGTSATAYAATAANTTEGTITTTRYGSINSVLPGNGDRNEWSLGREFWVPAGGVVRIRATATVAANMACYMLWNE